MFIIHLYYTLYRYKNSSVPSSANNGQSALDARTGIHLGDYETGSSGGGGKPTPMDDVQAVHQNEEPDLAAATDLITILEKTIVELQFTNHFNEQVAKFTSMNASATLTAAESKLADAAKVKLETMNADEDRVYYEQETTIQELAYQLESMNTDAANLEECLQNTTTLKTRLETNLANAVQELALTRATLEQNKIEIATVKSSNEKQEVQLTKTKAAYDAEVMKVQLGAADITLFTLTLN